MGLDTWKLDIVLAPECIFHMLCYLALLIVKNEVQLANVQITKNRYFSNLKRHPSWKQCLNMNKTMNLIGLFYQQFTNQKSASESSD